jgi:beta-barrel assembly-enhancing protease
MTRTTTNRLRRPLAAALVTMLAASGSLTAMQLISVKDEIEIGQQAQTEIRRQVPELTDQQTRRYVESLGRRLASHASGADYPYSFTVANQAELNAFALPGGPIWINRGILQTAAHESQVAGVLAHEVAHVARRHSAQQLTKATVAGGLLGLLGSVLGHDRGAGAVATQAVAGFTANSFMLKFSRDDEREADREGVRIMRAAGFDPRGMVEFMQVLRSQQGRNPGAVEQFLSTHPAPADRVRELERLAGAAPAGGRRDSDEFQQIRSRLAQLPPAPPTRR